MNMPNGFSLLFPFLVPHTNLCKKVRVDMFPHALIFETNKFYLQYLKYLMIL